MKCLALYINSILFLRATYGNHSSNRKKKMWAILLLVPCICGIALTQSRNLESGFSDQYKSENTLGEYSFGYNEDHTSGGSFRRESGNRFGDKTGSYGLRVGDGRVRIVNYVADRDGFRVEVFSNEPGLGAQRTNGLSKITKGTIHTVQVPGLRYSSMAPHLTFRGDRQPMADGVIEHDDDRDKDTERTYVEELSQDNLSDEDFAEVYSGRQIHSAGTFAEEGQFSKNLNGEYGYGSKNNDQNPSLDNSMVHQASDMSAVAEHIEEDSISAVSLVRDNDYRQIKQDGNYSPLTISADLRPLQSAAVLKKNEEPVFIDESRRNVTEIPDPRNKTATHVGEA